MRVTKRFHRFWLAIWLITLVNVALVSSRHFISTEDFEYQKLDAHRECLEQTKNAMRAQIAKTKEEASTFYDDCRDAEAFTEANYNASIRKNWILFFTAIVVFVPYLAVAVINFADGLVQEPDATEQKIEEVLRK